MKKTLVFEMDDKKERFIIEHEDEDDLWEQIYDRYARNDYDQAYTHTFSLTDNCLFHDFLQDEKGDLIVDDLSGDWRPDVLERYEESRESFISFVMERVRTNAERFFGERKDYCELYLKYAKSVLELSEGLDITVRLATNPLPFSIDFYKYCFKCIIESRPNYIWFGFLDLYDSDVKE